LFIVDLHGDRKTSHRTGDRKAFGILKIRFRILLDCVGPTDIKRIPELVIACCVLHNLCLMRNDVMDIIVIGDLNHQNEEFGRLNQGDMRDEENLKRIQIM